jgi:hypothetical protein
MRFCVLEQASYDVLGLLLDLPQVTFTAETLGIDLVNILRAGRPRGKPSVLGNHLDSTERKTVPRSCGKLRAYWLAGKFRHADLIGRECLQQLFLFGCRGRVDPLVEGQSSAISREIGNLTPADVYFGRGQTILIEGVVKGGSTMTQGVALVAVTDAVTALAERVNVDVGLVIAPELREVTGNVL